jgi:PAS domain S-box-containing protein
MESAKDEIRRLRARLDELSEQVRANSDSSSNGQAAAVVQPTIEAPVTPGGGEAGALIRAFDWNSTSIGPPAQWPQSLRTSLRTMLHSRFPMFVWWGPDLINFYNDAYIPMLGNRHPWALGRPAREAWSDIWDEVGRQAAAVIEEGKSTWNQELLLVMQRYGYTEETYFTFSYSPAFADDGSIGGVFCAVTEDTERVLSERRLHCLRRIAAQTMSARTAEEACNISAATLKEHGKDVAFALIYLFEQDGSARLAGATGVPQGARVAPETIASRSSEPWPLEEVRQGRSTVLRRAASMELPGGDWSEAAHTVALLPLSKSSLEQPRGFLVAGASPLREFDNRYSEFFELLAAGISGAITAAEAYHEEKRRAEALAALDHAKTAFFNNVSHEFRTPLTLMLGPLEDLMSKRGRALEAADWAQIESMLRNGLRLLRLVNTLLDFSRIEAGRTQAAFEPVDLSVFTANLASVFRSTIERAGMQLAVDCQPLPEPVYVDRDLWEKVVLNLISNAFKYTFEGRIEVSLRADGNEAVLRVSDTGVGIPQDQLTRIFERFYRVEGQRGRTHEGTGIGLSLVAELVKLHHGSVMTESVVGKGSDFTIRIPFGSAHLPAGRVEHAIKAPAPTSIRPEAYVAEAIQWLPAENAAGEPTANPGQGRILLADDNADMRNYLGRLLGPRYAVEIAADGKAALEAILKSPPDLVLTDVMMPGMSGLELLRAIRGNPRTSTLPVILLSARAAEESRVEGLEHGADDYLVKPFSAREVLACVASRLEIGRVRRESENRFRQLYAANVIGIASGDGGRILEANDAFLETIGRTREELESNALRWRELTPPEYEERDDRGLEEIYATGVCRPYEKEFFRQDGSRVPVLVGATLLDRMPLRWLCFALDLSHRKALEKRLVENQKLESLGALAAGIAHDFNNLLVGIMGNASLAQTMLPAADQAQDFLEEILKASDRLAHLTRQMLAYSGKGRFLVDQVDASDLVRGMSSLIETSVPRKVRLLFDLPGSLPRVEADADQLQQALMNLVLNASEAIGDATGTIYIRTGSRTINPAYIEREASNGEIEPGEYVFFEVRDTGCGMNDETRARIFDPFFTTKFIGRGLGLAAVAGIVRGHKGIIHVTSREGIGSAFTLLLPAANRPAPAAEIPQAPVESELYGEGAILVIDDEPLVSRAARLGLSRFGYQVLEAATGTAAIEMMAREKGRIKAVILDQSMPGMSGHETLPHLRTIEPDIDVIVSSGSSEAETLSHYAGQPVSGFLQKPYTVLTLAQKLKEVLSA